jgi:hypothetical protein
MAGRLTISTLNDDRGVLAVQNGVTGIAKAWINFNGTGTIAIRSSFNVSSITDNGTGVYTVTFTTAMPNANYSAICSTNGSGAGGIPIGGIVTYATGSCTVQTTTSAGVVDNSINSVAIFCNV